MFQTSEVEILINLANGRHENLRENHLDYLKFILKFFYFMELSYFHISVAYASIYSSIYLSFLPLPLSLSLSLSLSNYLSIYLSRSIYIYIYIYL